MKERNWSWMVEGREETVDGPGQWIWLICHQTRAKARNELKARKAWGWTGPYRIRKYVRIEE